MGGGVRSVRTRECYVRGIEGEDTIFAKKLFQNRQENGISDEFIVQEGCF